MRLSAPSRPRRNCAARLATLLLPVLLYAGCATTPPGTSISTPAATPLIGTPTLPNPATSAALTSAPAASAATAAAAAASATEVVAAPSPVDPLQPDVRVDLDDRTARTDLWARVRRGFAMPDLDNDQVHASERWYAERPDYVQRMTERGSRYLYHIVEELDRRGMPTELALLPFIESAFNPQAISSAQAAGMWQFIPSTGRHFSLTQNVFRDERRDILASTRAALDYLQKLYGMFGDWHLALAAYNWGEGNVQRAIARNERLGLPTDYGSLKMPNETQYYVPKLQAVKNIVAHPEDFGLTLPPVSNHPYFLSVPIEHDIDVALAVRLAQMSTEEFKFFNPQMNKPVILAAGTSQVLLPYENANLFVRGLTMHRGPLASWTAWVAPKTMRTADAAKVVGMDEDELRAVNKIPLRMLVRAGSTLVVPRSEVGSADVSGHIADNATMVLAPDVPPLRRLSLKAGRRDNVASIARRYRVSTAQVAQWNGVASGSHFKPGQTIVVYVAPTVRADAGRARVVSTNKTTAARATSAIKVVASKSVVGKAAPAKVAAKAAAPHKVATSKATPRAVAVTAKSALPHFPQPTKATAKKQGVQLAHN